MTHALIIINLYALDAQNLTSQADVVSMQTGSEYQKCTKLL